MSRSSQPMTTPTIHQQSCVFIFKIGLLLSLFVGSQLELPAQIRFETGTDGTPNGARVGTWYYNTKSAILSRLGDHGLQRISGLWGFDRAVFCDQLVLVEEMYFTRIFNAQGQLLSALSAKDLLPDSLLKGNKHITQYSNGLSRPVTIAQCNSSAVYRLAKLKGKDVMCLPQYADGILKGGVHQNDALKNWGMLSTDGEWLVEPKFDAPFRFQNGFADVLYYGEKRRINEKGEFVE